MSDIMTLVGLVLLGMIVYSLLVVVLWTLLLRLRGGHVFRERER